MTTNQTIETTILAAAEFQGVEPLELLGPLRLAEISAGRFAVFLVLREIGFTHRLIGKAFNLHHSAVVHGSKVARGREATDNQFRALTTRVRMAVANARQDESLVA